MGVARMGGCQGSEARLTRDGCFQWHPRRLTVLHHMKSGGDGVRDRTVDTSFLSHGCKKMKGRSGVSKSAIIRKKKNKPIKIKGSIKSKRAFTLTE